MTPPSNGQGEGAHTVKRTFTMFVNVPVIDYKDQSIGIYACSYRTPPVDGQVTKTFQLELEIPVRLEELPAVKAESAEATVAELRAKASLLPLDASTQPEQVV